MTERHATLAAEISKWPSQAEIVRIFESDDYVVIEGKSSVRMANFGHFVFRELGGNFCPGCVTADHEKTEELVAFSRRVSQTLAKSGIRHRFEVYSEKDELAAYVHYDWPKDW